MPTASGLDPGVLPGKVVPFAQITAGSEDDGRRPAATQRALDGAARYAVPSRAA